MTAGQVLLVVGQTADGLIVYGTTCNDNRAEVALADFQPFFAGIVVRGRAPLAQLAKRYNLLPKSGHWFWSQFGRFRRQLAEIALSSLVANLLAVAVALFSLQVFDRVIPHQSEAPAPGAAPSLRFSQMREYGSVREFFTASTIGTLAHIPFIFVFLLLVASIAGPVVWVLIAGGLLMVIPDFFLQKRMLRLTEETQGTSARSARVLRTLAPLTSLVATMACWGAVKTALDGLDSIATAPQDRDETRFYLRRDTLQGAFEVREVRFRYEEDGAPVLYLPALKIVLGQRVAVLGANGSGKASLLKLLCGLYAPEAGRMQVDGPQDKVREHLSGRVIPLTGAVA